MTINKNKSGELISLSVAVKLITELSGHALNRNSLRNQIVRGHWAFDAQKLGRDWYLQESDVRKYAKTYHGIKMGRPLKISCSSPSHPGKL